MRTTRAVASRAVVGAGLLAASVVWPGSPALAANDLKVEPSSGLRDGQPVLVTLEHWPADQAFIHIIQCNPDPQSLDDCVGFTGVNVPIEDGRGTASFTVSVLDDAARCARTHPCSLVAALDATDFRAGRSEAPLTFADTAPVRTTARPSAPRAGPAGFPWATVAGALTAVAAGRRILQRTRRSPERTPSS